MQEYRPQWIYPEARVLVADDMKLNLEIFRELTRLWKFDVDAVSDGAEAVEAAKSRSYQIIFLDNEMPKMTGMEAAVQIGKLCDTPLVAMTSALSRENQIEYVKSGFSEIFPKPINPDVLQKIIEKHMPPEYRKKADYTRESVNLRLGVAPDAYRRLLKTFISEIKPLLKELPDYALDEPELFRVKVHGIKGASRQLGKIPVSEFAEKLEAAAKSGNTAYIHSNLLKFLKELEAVIRGMEKELSNLPEQEKASVAQMPVQELFSRLKKGFDTYSLGQIEESLLLLKDAELSKERQELLERVTEAYIDLEYEKGSELLNDF